MNPGARPHEREAVDDLGAELGALGAMLRSTSLPEPPPACDAAIRAAAQEAARRKRHGGGRWSGVLAAAATVSLAVGIGWYATRDPQVAMAPAGERTAAAPAAPALERGNLAVQPVLAPRPTGATAAEALARPDPVAWLARIDALRRAGHPDEAAREEALLDATWPGWREVAAPGR